MKFFMILDVEPSKVAEMAQMSDKVWSNPPKGIKKLSQFTLLAPMPVQEPGRMRAIAVLEAESEQALVGIEYPTALIGTHIGAIPVLEMSVAPELGKLEQEIKGQTTKE